MASRQRATGERESQRKCERGGSMKHASHDTKRHIRSRRYSSRRPIARDRHQADWRAPSWLQLAPVPSFPFSPVRREPSRRWEKAKGEQSPAHSLFSSFSLFHPPPTPNAFTGRELLRRRLESKRGAWRCDRASVPQMVGPSSVIFVPPRVPALPLHRRVPAGARRRIVFRCLLPAPLGFFFFFV